MIDFCHLRRRFNWFLNLFVCNFKPERLKMFRFASIRVRPISDYDMLTEGRSARDLLRKKIASWQRGAKKKSRPGSANEASKLTKGVGKFP